MANTLVTPVVVADKILDYMDNILTIAGTINRQYDKDFKGGNGGTVNVVKPPKYMVQTGPAISNVQSINQGKIPVTVNNWNTVPIELTGVDLSMTHVAFEDWSKTFLEPAASALANSVEQAIYGLYNQIPNHVGTPGTPPASYDSMAAAAELLTYNGCPPTEKYAALNPTAWRKLGGGLTTLFNPSGPIGEAVTTGKVPEVAGFKTFQAQNVAAHTVGALGGTPLVNGASQVGSNLVTNGWSNSITNLLLTGDVFTVAGVFGVNPVTKASTGILQEFVVTGAVNSDGAGNATIPIYPSIITSGAFQTVTASPANAAALTIKTGTASTAYAQNLAYHRNALGLVMVPVKAPDGVKASTTRTYKNYSVTITHDADIMNFKEIWRADILFGTAVFYPELACRITN